MLQHQPKLITEWATCRMPYSKFEVLVEMIEKNRVHNTAIDMMCSRTECVKFCSVMSE